MARVVARKFVAIAIILATTFFYSGSFANAADTISPPAPPTGFTIVAFSDGSIELTWNLATDSPTAPLTGYRVYESVSEVNLPIQALGPKVSALMVTGIVNDRTYQFSLESYGPGGSSNSATITFVPANIAAGNPSTTVFDATAPAIDLTMMVPIVSPASTTDSPGPTSVPTPTATATPTPIATFTPTSTSAPTPTATATPTPTATATPTPTATATPTPIVTSTSTSSATATPVVLTNPSNFAIVPRAGSVDLSWTAMVSTSSIPISGYRIYQDINGVPTIIAALPINTTSFTVSNLTNGTIYNFSIASYNSTSESPQASLLVIPIIAPSAPTNVVLTASDTRLTANWTPAISTYSSPVTSQTVTVVGGDSFNLSNATTSQLITGLTNGTTYTITICSANSAGTICASDTATPISPPATPSEFTASAGDSMVLLSWDPVTSTLVSPLSGYHIYVDISGTPQLVKSLDPSSVSTVMNSLMNGTAYTYLITAYGPSGDSSNAALTITPIAPPSAPTGVSVTVSDGTLTANWSPAISTDSSPVTSQAVSVVGGTSYDLTNTDVTKVITGLANGTSYTIRVCSINSVGTTCVSDTATPISPPATPSEFTATVSDGGTDISWNVGVSSTSAPLSGYHIYENISGDPILIGSAGSTATSFPVTGLTNGTAYTFAVAAYGPAEESASASLAVTPISAPSSPIDLLITPNDSKLVVNWTSATSTAESPVTSQTVTVVGGASYDLASSITSQDIMDLVNGTAYTITVCSVNSVGASCNSDTATPIALPTIPAEIILEPGDTQLTVNWTPADSTSQAPVASQTVSIEGVATFSSLADASTQLITGLTNGMAYTVTVCSANTLGTTCASESATPISPPSAPTGLSLTVSNGQITADWTPALDTTDAPVISQTVSVSDGQQFDLTNIDTTQLITGLTNGTSYTVTVCSVNPIGTTCVDSTVTPIAIPTTPSGFAVATGDTTISLSWGAVDSTVASPLTGYHVYVDISGTPQLIESLDPASVSAVISNLTNGTSYTYSIATYGPAGESSKSALNVTPIVAPRTPVGLSLTVSDSQLTADWIPALSTADAPVVSQTVSVTGGASFDLSNTATSQLITGLVNGNAYTVTVCSVNAVGITCVDSTATPIAIPVTPSGFAVVAGDATISLAWDAVTPSVASPLGGYHVYMDSVLAATLDPSLTAYQITELNNGVTHTFSIASYGPTGESSLSELTATPITAPAAPTGLILTVGDGQLSTTWTHAASPVSAPVISQTVTVTDGASFTGLSNSAKAQLITGLTNGVTYTITVCSVNPIGIACVIDTATPIAPPALPTAVSLTVHDGALTANWTPADSPVSAPVVSQTVTVTGGASFTDLSNGTATQFIDSLTNGVAYTVTVCSVNAVSTTCADPITATPISAPLAPENFVLEFGNAQITANWTPGASSIAAPVVSQTVNVIDGASYTGLSSTTSTKLITGLTNGTVYTIEVCSVNSVGTTCALSATATPITIPTAPTIGTATQTGASTATISFSASLDNGGSTITHYDVTSDPTGGTGSISQVGSGVIDIAGLSSNTSYTFMVTATNAAGTSDPSSSSNTILTLPDAPVIGTTTDVGTGRVYNNGLAHISFTVPTNGADSYIVTSDNGGYTGTGTCSPISVTGLQSGADYSFTVVAINASGSSASSESSNSVTTTTVPQAPTIGTVSDVGLSRTYNNGLATVGFTPGATGGLSTTYTATSNTGGYSGSGGSPISVQGLQSESPYTFTVVATNANGSSLSSADSNSITATTVPQAPTIGTATNIGVGRAYNNGLATVGYTANGTGGLSTTYTATSSTGSYSATGGSPISVTGLQSATAYTFSVVAMNANGSSVSSADSNSITATTVPQAPTIGPATDVGSGRPYNNGLVAVGYTTGATGGLSTTYTATSSAGNYSAMGGSPISVQGLQSEGTYTFTVVATNANGSSIVSSASNSVTATTIPQPVTIGTATDVGLNRPYDNGQASIGYTINGTGGLAVTYVATSSVGAFTGTSATFPISVTGLHSGIVYTFTVVASNANGSAVASSASNSITATTIPQAPTIGTASDSGSGRAYNNGLATVAYTPNGTGGTTVTYMANASAGGYNGTGISPISVSGQQSNVAYTYTVTATNANGSATSSLSNSVTTTTVPQAPTISTATNVGTNRPYNNGLVTVSFTDNGTGGSTITGHTGIAFGGPNASGASPISVTGLQSQTGYTFTVTATNANGSSVASSASGSVTTTTVPQAPTIGTATNVGTGRAYNNGLATVSYTLGATGGLSTTYTATSSTGNYSAAGGIPISVVGLQSGSAYTFTIVASNANGSSIASSASNSITVTTVPQAPTIGTVTNVGLNRPYNNGLATVAFSNNGTGGSTITNNTATASAGSYNGSGASPISVTGLQSATAYTYTVTATNANGTSLASSASSSVTSTTVPQAPTIGTATNVGTARPFNNGAANVTFTSNANGGSTITGYTANGTVGGSAASSPVFVSSLASGGGYSWTITATNANGTSAASASSNSITATTVPQAPTIGAAADSGSGRPYNNGAATIGWTSNANGGSAIVDNRVYVNGTGQVGGSPHTIGGLASATSYFFTATSYNANGESLPSSNSNSMTATTVPQAPTIGTATAGLLSATIGWTSNANGGAGIDDNEVWAYTGGGVYINGTGGSPHTITGLTPWVNCYFYATSHNVNGYSANSAASNTVTPYAPVVSGGTLYSDGTYYYRVFLSNGTLSVTGGSVTFDTLVVAGGGGAGAYFGTGGAGGLLYTPGVVLVSGSAPAATIGAGGGIGINGSNSSLGGYVAIGGGSDAGMNWPGTAGGSGGGGADGGYQYVLGGAGTAGQGYAGGDSGLSWFGGGGGGGAGGVGGNAGAAGGAPGPGSYAYASWAAATGTGGPGGYYAQGGNGSGVSSGLANTGNGADGASWQPATAVGGSGIVIVRYTRSQVGG